MIGLTRYYEHTSEMLTNYHGTVIIFPLFLYNIQDNMFTMLYIIPL
jgi:hypothetical protein